MFVCGKKRFVSRNRCKDVGFNYKSGFVRIDFGKKRTITY